MKTFSQRLEVIKRKGVVQMIKDVLVVGYEDCGVRLYHEDGDCPDFPKECHHCEEFTGPNPKMAYKPLVEGIGSEGYKECPSLHDEEDGDCPGFPEKCHICDEVTGEDVQLGVTPGWHPTEKELCVKDGLPKGLFMTDRDIDRCSVCDIKDCDSKVQLTKERG